MIEPHNPLALIVPGAPTVSLKNEREIVEYLKDGKKQHSLIPSARVTKFMGNTRAAIRRQLPGDWNMLEGGIAVVLEMHEYYTKEFPRNDIDNFYTTIQECLEETVIENDRQIEYFLAIRKKSTSKLGQHSMLFIWETSSFSPLELIKFLNFKETYNGKDQLRFTGTVQCEYAGLDTDDDGIEVPDPF